jgi:hypothetical protein
VLFLADRMNKGTPVRFRDIQGRTGDQDATGSGSRVDSIAKARARGETAPAPKARTDSTRASRR